MSVISCVASPRPGENGTETSLPAAFAASSMAVLPASTMTSATLAPRSFAIGSRTARTRCRRSGSLPSQSFCGARRIRAPLAPPRMSEPRQVRALSQAVATRSAIDSPLDAILALTASTS